MSQLPASLRHSPSFAFVGRERELDVLRTLVPRSPGAGRQVALIAGEAGSGKSRLVRELAGELSAEGATVLYGACNSAVRAPYRPFVEALDDLFRQVPRDDLAGLPGTATELSRLLPDLAPPAGEPLAPASTDPDTERHRLHLAVSDLLASASRRTPLLLVLEDVHWADAGTLLLLEQLARGSEARLLLLVTYRDAEADLPAEVSEALVEVRRSEGVARLRLTGLSPADIGEFARKAAGVDPAADVATVLAELTGGNPFLLTELWRELVDTGSLSAADGLLELTRPAGTLGTPEAVRAVVTQRLERLPAHAAAALQVAAVAGGEFELTTLRSAAGLQDAELLDALAEAERSGLISEVPAGGLAYRFGHELVRRAVIDRLPAPRRADLHLRVAEALERGDPAADPSGRLAALAHHFTAAAPLGGTERAVAYNLLAARSAAAALAFDEAAERLRTALALGFSDPGERAEAYLELGSASHRAGNALDALEAFERTTEVARAIGDAELLARAAVGFEETCWRPAIHDAGTIELLQEASAALGEEDSELRTRLLGGLARALDFRGESIRAARARDESIAMARRRGDRASLALTLAGSYWSRGSSSAEVIQAMLLEALEIGEELGDLGICTDALGWLVPSSVLLCDHDAARHALGRLFEAARRQSQPFHLHVAEHYASALALCDGELAEAEAAAVRSHEWSRLLTGRDASGVYGIQMFSIRREEGRISELAPVIRLLAGKNSAAWRPGFAALLAELGMNEEAGRTLRQVVFEELDLHRRTLWLAALTYLADASAALGDPAAAQRLYPELAANRGSTVVVGHLVSCYGAADRYLGMLASVLGEWELAEEHFEAALALNRKLGARTWLARTAYEYGRMLLARGRDRSRAEALLGESLGLSRSIGMTALASRIEALGGSIRAPAPRLDGLSPREAEILRLVAQGLSNRDIGRSLFISEHTTANHVRSILRKTGCANRTEAAAYAHRHGFAGA
jgi:predicted ATPase/DNA-binding CsgD family transcriptional regulator